MSKLRSNWNLLRNYWSQQPHFRRNESENKWFKDEREFAIQVHRTCIKSLPVLFKVQKCKWLKSSTTERQQVFHLFFLEHVSVVWLLLFMLRPVMSCSSPLAIPSVKGLDKNPWTSMPWKWWPSLLRASRFVWSRDPVLLHFFTGGVAKESGVNSDVRERLFSVSDKCSLLKVWRQLSLSVPVPTSSSEGSMESCWGHPGLMLPPPLLLWLLWCLRVAWRVKGVLCLFSKEWSRSPVVGPWGCKGRLGRLQRRGMGRSRWRGEETLKLSPSSSVVCRLPSELPVAREESLWDGCWKRE